MVSKIITKEIKENFFAMKGVWWMFVVAILFSGMTYSFVTVKELSLLAQTEVVVTMSKMILGVSLLVSIILASVSFSNEKEQSTLESLMLTPMTNMDLAAGKLVGVLFMWFMIALVSMPYLIVLTQGTTIVLSTILFTMIIGFVINLIFAMLAMSLSIMSGSSKNAMVTSIIIFLITAIPAFLSTTMKKVGFGMVLEKVSPLSNVIKLMKGILINHQSIISLSQYLVPLMLYVIIAFMLLKFTLSRFNFEGDE
jgi:ABC-2 type transport system permease protein